MPKTTNLDVASELMQLGFSETEALAYCAVLQEPGSTGYRVAKTINKQQANAYQALAGLVHKGAVSFEEGESRTYRATPPRELLGRLRTDFERQCEAVERSLMALEGTAGGGDRFYQLRTGQQVYDRARSMLADAQETVLFEALTGPLQELRPEFEATATRGVKVAGMITREGDRMEGVRCLLSRRAEIINARWPADPLTLIVDARCLLIALMDRQTGEPRQALWSDSPYLAVLFHSAIGSNVVLHADPLIDRVETPGRYLFGQIAPGVRDFVNPLEGEKPR